MPLGSLWVQAGISDELRPPLPHFSSSENKGTHISSPNRKKKENWELYTQLAVFIQVILLFWET